MTTHYVWKLLPGRARPFYWVYSTDTQPRSLPSVVVASTTSFEAALAAQRLLRGLP